VQNGVFWFTSRGCEGVDQVTTGVVNGYSAATPVHASAAEAWSLGLSQKNFANDQTIDINPLDM
jgi:hypothetical protein